MQSPHHDYPTKSVARAHAYLESLRNRSPAPVQSVPCEKRVFHHIVIENRHFLGLVTMDGPYISEGRNGCCPLGAASINRCGSADDFDNVGVESWHVAKYHREGHINIEGLSEAGRRALAIEFGLPLYDGDAHPPVDAQTLFQASPAAKALGNWLDMNPQLRRTFAPSVYLGDWTTRN